MPRVPGHRVLRWSVDLRFGDVQCVVLRAAQVAAELSEWGNAQLDQKTAAPADLLSAGALERWRCSPKRAWTSWAFH